MALLNRKGKPICIIVSRKMTSYLVEKQRSKSQKIMYTTVYTYTYAHICVDTA